MEIEAPQTEKDILQNLPSLPPTTRLPFSFAKRQGAAIERTEDGWLLYYQGEPNPTVFSEVRRVLGQNFSPVQLMEEEFDSKLTELYQRDSSEAQQLMEDIGADDDFFTLAEELPQSEDLLESEDDAPIIKLINAMLPTCIIGILKFQYR